LCFYIIFFVEREKGVKHQRIRVLREDADLSQRELAEKLGLYTTTYARYEQGNQEIPFYLAIELAKFYDVSLDYIAGIVPVKEKLSR
jgi:transcriptional regulator with XRE-family HTH domain